MRGLAFWSACRCDPLLRRGCCGFSVPEILAVVAILSIILSILLPSFQQAKRQAKQVLCQSNHRNIVLAARTYSSENQQYLPFPNSNAYESSGLYTGPGWLYKAPNKSLPKHIEAGSLWPYLKDVRVYRCPMDEPPWNMGPVQKITSFGFNAELRSNVHLPSTRTHQLRSNAVIMWETDETQGGGYWNDGNNLPNEHISRRHSNGANIGVIDGSIPWWTYDQWVINQLKIPGPLYCSPLRY